jgi:two-component system, cell cycle response regulator
VDDSLVIRRVVGDHLRRAGYEVEESSDGAEALDRLEQRAFDAIITDLQMPKADGFTVLETVKKRGLATEVIILTGGRVGDMSSAIRALRLGAHDFLIKPPSSAEDLVFTVGRAVEKKRLRETNERLMRELERISRTDALTGAANRRAFDEALRAEIARARRVSYPVSLALFDLDHFKSVNDTHGHPAGDAVLREFAQRAMRNFRTHETVYRYGGEEFATILPHTPLGGALQATRRLIAAVAATPFAAGAVSLPLTVSAGVSAGMDIPEPSALISAADTALYDAKHTGRNRAVGRLLPGPPADVPR